MKTLTNKLVLSVLALVLTGVALSVGVFAWFTINNTATIQSFNGTVQTGDGFYVSLDGSTWQNTLTSTQMQGAAGTVTFVPLTSADGAVLKDLAGTTVTAGYIEFDLLFAGSMNRNAIVLNTLELAASTTTWVPGVDVANTRSAGAPNNAITEFVSNAARVSFQDVGTPANITVFEQAVGKGASTSAANLQDNGNTLGFGTFTTNEAVLFYNAIMDADIDSTAFTAAVNPATAVAGSLLTNNIATLYAWGTTLGSHTFDVSTIDDVVGVTPNISVVTVRVWVEGWDQEALNAILSGVLTVNFNLNAIA